VKLGPGRIVIAALLAAAAPLWSCGTVHDRFRECEEVNVTMSVSHQVLAGANVIAENETVSAGNFLAPGAARVFGVCVERGDRKRFIAFRNGVSEFQATCVATFSDDQALTAHPKVELGPTELACQDW
jgi:hypothetical protein